MKLSTKARYGLKACFVLAKAHGSTVNSAELSKASGVTPKYLDRLLRLLMHDGLVVSERGVSGGYRLTREPENISVGEVFRALEDNLEISDCVGAGCAEGNCPNRNILRKLYISINEVLDKHSLQDLVNDHKGGSLHC